MSDSAPEDYLPIDAYGAIGNLYTTALVGRAGSLDWCCFPHLDSPSVFAAILDRHRGGRFCIEPRGGALGSQRYRQDTNVLDTRFRTPGGQVRLTDWMPVSGVISGTEPPHTTAAIYRVLSGEAGECEMDVEWSPRFDYARAEMTMREVGGGWEAQGGDERLTLLGLRDARVEETRFGPILRGSLTIREGQNIPLFTWYGEPPSDWKLDDWAQSLARTKEAWRGWLASTEHENACAWAGAWQPLVHRSGLVLKLLTYPETGAIAAAPTTSLPEHIGGVRNWDYRYTWIRDASFTAQALVALGHRGEAVDFLEWAERTAMSKRNGELDLQIMYGLRGEQDLPEFELDHLEGYRRSRPVRVGNAAAKQLQLDIFGELMSAAHDMLRLGVPLDEQLCRFLTSVADEAARRWREPDFGIWEVRRDPLHFTYSKLMVWVALDRAIRIAARTKMPGNVETWSRERDAVRDSILEHGYDEKVGSFVQSFGSTALDAANLLIPTVGFLPFDDPRVQGTIDATLERLTENGLVYRYHADDGLPGGEGAFGLTTFWMIDALSMSGRLEEAHDMFANIARQANPVGLYSEEIDPATGKFLGNFPQAFTHIGLINSVVYMAEGEGRDVGIPAPIGTAPHRRDDWNGTDSE